MSVHGDIVVQRLCGLPAPADAGTFSSGGETVNARALGLRLSNAALGKIIEQGGEDLISVAAAIMVPPADTDTLTVYAGLVPPRTTGPHMTYLLDSLEPFDIEGRQIMFTARYTATLRVPLDTPGGANEVSDTIAARLSSAITNTAALVGRVIDVRQSTEDATRMLVTDIDIESAYLAVEQQAGETFAESQALPAALTYLGRRGNPTTTIDSYGLDAVAVGSRSPNEGLSVTRSWSVISIAKVGGGALDIAETVRGNMLGHKLSTGYDSLALTDGGPLEPAGNTEIWRDTYGDNVRYRRVG